MNIQDAMDILASRSAGGNEVNQIQPPNGSEKLGQTLDLEWTNMNQQCCAPDDPTTTANVDLPPPIPSQVTDQTRAKNEKISAERQKKMAEEVAKMSVEELVRGTIRAQEERVMAYRVFDEKLRECLTELALSNYQVYAAHATAQFSAISNGIRTILAALLAKNTDEEPTTGVTTPISNLQNHEREKLRLTAALHLEKIRAAAETDDKIKDLLSKSVVSYQNSLTDLGLKIEEEVDELRSALV